MQNLYVCDNEGSADADLSVGNIGSAQVNSDVILLLNDSVGDIGSLGITEGYSPLIYNDDNISIEENTSIEIRGPPLTLGEMALQGSYLTRNLLSVQNGDIVLSDGQVLFLGSGPTPSELNLSLPTNINAADTLNTDQLWSGGGLGLDLTGSGLTVGIWEAGDGAGGYYVRDTHQELAGRVVFAIHLVLLLLLIMLPMSPGQLLLQVLMLPPRASHYRSL
ncbi:MAG: hypothetical protein FVQ84_17230 [Planctomycetes bacterium]|nr:hypothetical protein [Planctomycetota bacterium]